MLRRFTPSPLVLARYRAGRPTAVARVVTEIVVDPIKDQVRRRFFHVSQKIYEAQPPLTNGDASTAVVLPVLIPLVETPVLHVAPTGIGARNFPIACMAMRYGMGASVAATARGAPTDQVGDKGDAFGPAIAAASPARSSRRHMREAQRDKTPESLIGDIFESGHNGLQQGGSCQGAADVQPSRRPALGA
jgi:hypothetical protein